MRAEMQLSSDVQCPLLLCQFGQKLKWRKTPKYNCPISDDMNIQETFLELLQADRLEK
jgi:hypothetical protein